MGRIDRSSAKSAILVNLFLIIVLTYIINMAEATQGLIPPRHLRFVFFRSIGLLHGQ